MPPMPPGGIRRSFFLFRNLGDDCFGGEQQAGDGRRVLQRAARDLGRIDDARFHQVGVFRRWRRRSLRCLCASSLPATMSAPSWPALSASCGAALRSRGARSPRRPLSSPSSLQVIERFLRADECHTAARDDAFFNRGASRVQRVFDARFLLFHLGLSRGADVDHGHAAGEFRQTLLQFLAIVIAKSSLRSDDGSAQRGP